MHYKNDKDMIRDYIKDELESRCNEYNENGEEMYGEDAEQMSLREYVEREAKNDSSFFFFLFGTDDVTEEMMEEYQDWLDTL